VTKCTLVFGSTQPANTGTSIFGGGTGTGIFGTAGQQQPSATQQLTQTGGFGNLFGAKPAGTTPSLFSGTTPTTTQPQTSLFGTTQPATHPSLFGTKPPAPALGASISGQPGLFGTFGTSTSAPGTTAPQPSLTASIAEPIQGTNLPIFDILPPGPRTVDLDQSQPKKKPGFFVDIPTRSPLPRQMGYAPASSKLRGFGSSTIGSANGLNSAGSLSFTSGKSNALSLNGSMRTDGMLVRSASPVLGSGTRQSVKKVILDKKVEPSELFIKSGGPGSFRGGKVTFSPALSVAAREKDAAGPLSPTAHQLDSPTPTAKIPSRSHNKFTAEPIHPPTPTHAGDIALQEGDYYIKPDLATLKKASYDQLSSYGGLVVGRVGYGEIHFLEPVDLTGLSKLGALLGDVVRFDDKECSVYPDSEDVDKPPPGSGLNVKARLILERCWATDKASREAIKDASHPTAVKHLKRLKNMKDTEFESFEVDSGKWTFTVDHF
jgi:nuclear pore complex protein Nup98-Nup96